MVVICLGPICVPIYAFLPVLWALWQRCKAYVLAWWRGEQMPNSSADDFMSCKDGVCELKQPLDSNSLNASGDSTSLAETAAWSSTTKEVRHVGSAEEWAQLTAESKNGNKPLVVKFTATWCMPCKKIAPVFKDICNEVNAAGDKAMFVEVDVDELDQVMAECSVGAMPTFQVYRNGSMQGQCRGANETALRSLIDDHCK